MIDGPPGSWLVDRSIAALRALFGPRVALVGACDELVAQRGDATIPDAHPGVGPAGGILSALRACGDVFVLPGDLPSIGRATIEAIAVAAGTAPQAWAVLAQTDRIEPCVGIYRRAAMPALEACIRAGSRLGDALPRERIALVPVTADELANVNVPGDLQ